MTNEENMALCAIRYCMGRMSYIVSDGIAWARRYGAQSKHLRGIVIRDIEEAIVQMERCPDIPMLGDKIDEREWRAVLSELKALEEQHHG